MEYLGVILDINLRYLYINSLLGKLGFIILTSLSKLKICFQDIK